MEFLRSNEVGLILRIFAKKPELVDSAVKQILDTASRANALEIDGISVFSRIDVMVAMDHRYPDCDCGETAEALKKVSGESFHVREVFDGEIFVDALNLGLGIQVENGITHSMMLSPGVASYLTEENMRAMLSAFEAGALATGLAIPPFTDSIMRGRLLDTCDIWDNQALLSVGGYNRKGAQPFLKEAKDKRQSIHYCFEASAGDFVYTFAGVEEMFPLIALVRENGHCIAPIRPAGSGEWTLPDDPDVRRREELKILSKEGRQQRACMLEGVDPDFLYENGVMAAYK